MAQRKEFPMQAQPVSYRSVKVDGLNIFYREAGAKDAPTILLLHGLPSSSRMFDPLFARLSDRYHLVAPDYPGFGHSDWPDPKQYSYTFDKSGFSDDAFHGKSRTDASTRSTCKTTVAQSASGWRWRIPSA